MPDVVGLDTAGLSPWLLRSLNKYWPRRNNRQLNADQMISAALKKSSVKQFDEDWDPEALSVLVHSINRTARLSPLGNLIIKKRLEGALATRLRALDWFNRHPEILEQEVAPIVLITGLQRTGTTYLQRLLSSDPASRALLSWESLDPVPHGSKDERRKRIRNARISEKALAWMAPGFFAIHPIEHEGPEEDVLLLDPTFYSTAPEAIMHVPEFAAWLEGCDHTSAYRWEAKMLKLLQWQNPASKWILKSPHHLEHLSAFASVFPNTRVIWTHRDPAQCMPSFLSMVYHGRRMFSDDVPIEEVRAHWAAKLQHMLSRAIEFRDQSDVPILDVLFKDIVRDPLACLGNIYDALEFDLSSEAEAGFESVIAGHGRNRFGKHKYQLEEFGLATRDVKAMFAPYYQLLNRLNA